MKIRRSVRTDKAPQPSGHYQQAVTWGDLIFVAGQGPTHPVNGSKPAGIEAQVRQALQNLEAILRAAGSDRKHVMRCGVFLADLNDFDAMNRVYAKFFGANPPARTTVEAGLGDILVEIDAIAVRRTSDEQ
jgi:2-iminobutanoate/2-iminopropanoate deaminase